MTAEEAQKEISEYHPNSAILNYQLGIQESFLIVSTRSGSYIFKLPDWKTISKAVAGWRVQVQSQLHSSHQSDEAFSNYNQIAHLLYNFLIAPAAQLIRGRDLIMIPSDALCQIAFEALVLNDTSRPGQRPEYLIEQHAISYVPSASVLSEIESRWQPALPAKRMLLLGDAIVADNDTKIEQGDHRPTVAALDRLPAARLEVLEIARLAEQHRITATILLDSLANEDDFKARDLSVFRYIHIATHGMSDYQDGDASALTLAANAGGSEDGILTGDEIAKLKLKAELVVLSGCETGSGQKDGAEGIVGLNRAFLIAGARCVCGSLWPVEDASTRKLMNSFYRRLIVNGLSKSHALRLAKLEMIKSGMPPSRWAPFILIGTPR